MWALPFFFLSFFGEGEGLNPCPDGLGHFLEKNFPSSNGHLLDFGGVETLARMVWGTYSEKMAKIAIWAMPK